MFLVGILRHNITIIMAAQPKVDPKAIRETYAIPPPRAHIASRRTVSRRARTPVSALLHRQALQRARMLRANGNCVHRAAFLCRKEYLAEKITEGAFLRNPKAAGGNPAMVRTRHAAVAVHVHGG